MDDLQSLFDRPGFMIRRAHQIAQTVFLEECAEFSVTPTQYGVMRVVAAHNDIDLVGVARALEQDRSTTALVVNKLVDDGMIGRMSDPADGRRRILTLTAKGRVLVAQLATPVQRAQERLLDALGAQDGETFLRLLRRLNRAFKDIARTDA